MSLASFSPEEHRSFMELSLQVIVKLFLVQFGQSTFNCNPVCVCVCVCVCVYMLHVFGHTNIIDKL